MSAWNIAVVGATGQVGSALIELLEKSPITIEKLYAVGSDNSEGDIVRFSGKNVTVKESNQMDWGQCHFAFFVASKTVTETYALIAAESGCIVIDASGYFAEHDHIPLVVPKINNSVLAEYRNDNIVCVANPIVCQLLRASAALTDLALLTHLHVTNFIAASLYGKKGVNELAGQSAKLLNGLPADNQFFDKQLAFNLLPVSHQKNQHWLSEKNLVDQIRKVTQNYPLLVSIDSVTVPVFYGVSQSVSMTSNMPIQLEASQFDLFGIELLEDDLPTPVTEVNGESQDEYKIKIANVRHSYGNFEQVQFWSVADNIRYLGALMLIETLEILINDYF